MSIKIDTINAQGIGPITEFSEKMASVNLIYGSNEQGKTFLVEFILKSLFKNLKEFNLRPGDPSGTVLVSGLDKDPITFSSKAKKKLEDYLETNKPGMPPKISRLLVVKGAELDLDDKTRGGVSKTIIKSFLSSQSTLDLIQKGISKTLQGAKIESEMITGNESGELKARNGLIRKLSAYDKLLMRVNQDFSSGNRAGLIIQINELEKQKEEMRKAKCFRAGKIAKEIHKVEAELSDIEEKGVDPLLQDLKDWEETRRQLDDKQKKLEIAKKNSQHYEWLGNAIVDYEKMFARGGISINNWLLVAGGIAIFLGFILSAIGMFFSTLVKQPVLGVAVFMVGLIVLFGGVVLGFLHLRQYRNAQAYQAESEEIKRISSTYENLFGLPLKDIVTLKTTQKNIESDYYFMKKLKDEIDQDQAKLTNIESSIVSCLSRFGFEGQGIESWKKAAETINSNREKLVGTKNSLKYESATFSDIQPEEYLETDPGREYSGFEMKRIEEKLDNVNQMIHAEDEQLQTLRNEIQTMICETIPMSWEKLIERLRADRLEVAQEYASLTSRIIASILVQGVIDNARLQEDENIRNNLAAPGITKPLLKITGRYQTIRMDDDILKVSDKFDEFGMDELSTGAREQVFLALRIGFASKLLGQDGAFIILDDAFQHSDWKRRVNLVKQTMDLAKSGWQILYFSMDDHIKSLFDEYGKKGFGKQYKSFDITKKD